MTRTKLAAAEGDDEASKQLRLEFLDRLQELEYLTVTDTLLLEANAFTAHHWDVVSELFVKSQCATQHVFLFLGTKMFQFILAFILCGVSQSFVETHTNLCFRIFSGSPQSTGPLSSQHLKRPVP